MDTDFLYSKEAENEIKEQLMLAEKSGRITINEWRNFIDYDVTLLMKWAVEEYVKIAELTERSKE